MSEPQTKVTGVKYDSGKVRFSLVPTKPLTWLARVYTMGAAKYEDNGWRNGLKWSRIYDALQRHLTAFWGGQDMDDESGLPHLAHAAWGCFTLLEYMETWPTMNDRYVTETRNHVLPVSPPTPAADDVLHEAVESIRSGAAGSLVFEPPVRFVDRVEIPAAAKAARDSGLPGSFADAKGLARETIS
jgi:hypothetical protein